MDRVPRHRLTYPVQLNDPDVQNQTIGLENGAVSKLADVR
jgi:hypothetical protein